MRFNDLTGMTFSRWTVVSFAGARRWVCRCQCGQMKEVYATNLTAGKSRSCGCLSVEITKVVAAKHGLARVGRVTPEYRAWQGMKDRCTNQNNKSYSDYGGRGITVCDEWMSDFSAFFAHVGPKPTGEYSLDRLRVDEGYKPGNVRWATDTQQARNRRNVPTVGGKDVPSLRLENGVSRTTYHRRIRNGLAPEDAATVRPRAKRANGTGRARG